MTSSTLLVEFINLGLVHVQPRQTAFVEDGDRRAIIHGILDVIDADVIAKDGARVPVLQMKSAFR
jgi:hypothetical protein